MARMLTVGQLAHITGVPAKTIRYYEQVGVLPSSSRSATGYRQYSQRDVHRLLFIRRARALGLSLPNIKALTAELDSGQCLSLRPHLKQIVTEQLRTVRAQVVEFQLLEQQLAQVLHRLLTVPPSNHTEGCRCLEIEAPAVQGTAQQPPPLTCGGEDMSASNTLESLTLLTTPTKGSCGCGCSCDDFPFAQLVPLQPSTVRAGEEERVRPQESRTGDVTRR